MTKRAAKPPMRNLTLPPEVMAGEADLLGRLRLGPTPESTRYQRVGAILVASVYLLLGALFMASGIAAGWTLGRRIGFWPGLALGIVAGPVVTLFLGVPAVRVGWSILSKWMVRSGTCRGDQGHGRPAERDHGNG